MSVKDSSSRIIINIININIININIINTSIQAIRAQLSVNVSEGFLV